MKLGAHESVAGGLVRAFERADARRGEAIQIFTSNGSQWAPQRRDRGEISEFASEARRRGTPLIAHDSYLINLAAGPGVTRDRSEIAFAHELERCEELGVAYVVMHPGAHMGAGVAAGIRRVAARVKAALRRTRGYRVGVLLELTAGQGTCLGHTFEELGALLDGIGDGRRTGVCFDTCHALAAGYDWRTPRGYEAMWRDFDRAVGLGRIRAFHLNDSKRDVGARVDRHEAVGEGFVGAAPFKRLVRDPRFAGIPAVVELPPDETARSLEKLKSWRPRRYAGASEAEAPHRG